MNVAVHQKEKNEKDRRLISKRLHAAVQRAAWR